MRRGTTEPQRPKRLSPEEERALPVQERLYRSLKLWGLYVDLEESLGTVESTRRVYDRIMELRIATPQIVLNYAHYLQVGPWGRRGPGEGGKGMVHGRATEVLV